MTTGAATRGPLVDRVFGTETEWSLCVTAPPDYCKREKLKVVDEGRGLVLPNSRLIRSIMRAHLPEVIDVVGTLSIGGAMHAGGGRIYEDQEHPESATPECTTGAQLIRAEEKNEGIMVAMLDRAVDSEMIGSYVLNNCCTDGHGKTWGCHESYQTRRELLNINKPEHRKKAYTLSLFLATRSIFVGSGAVIDDLDTASGQSQSIFVIAQKAAHLNTDVSQDTLKAKPLLNTRDEPLADIDEFCRLHITSGDPNMSWKARWMATGMTRIMLTALEAGIEPTQDIQFGPNQLHQLARGVARDPSCKKQFTTVDGQKVTSLFIQGLCIEMGHKAKGLGLLTPELEKVLDFWGSAHGDALVDPMRLSTWSDWPARMKVLGRNMETHEGLTWNSLEIRQLDLDYSRINSQNGKQGMGQVFRRKLPGHGFPLPENEADDGPPNRGHLRGRFVKAFAAASAAARAEVAATPNREYDGPDCEWQYFKSGPPQNKTHVLRYPHQASHLLLEDLIDNASR